MGMGAAGRAAFNVAAARRGDGGGDERVVCPCHESCGLLVPADAERCSDCQIRLDEGIAPCDPNGHEATLVDRLFGLGT